MLTRSRWYDYAIDGQRSPAYDLTPRFNEQVRIAVAFEALFSHPTLDGPYVELEPPTKVPPNALLSQESGGGYGYASIAEGESVVVLIRYELWPEAPAKVLRLSFEAEGVATRLASIDEWMAGLGRWVFRALPFEVGVVGDSFLSDWTGEAFLA